MGHRSTSLYPSPLYFIETHPNSTAVHITECTTYSSTSFETRCGLQVHILRYRKTLNNDILGVLLKVPPFSILPAIWNRDTVAGTSAATLNYEEIVLL